MDYLAFQVSGEAFAVSLLRVREVSVAGIVTRVPGAHPALLGVVNVRGGVVPVVDVAARLGRVRSRSDRACLVHVNAVHEGVTSTVALAVDGLDGILRLEQEDVLPPPAALSARERDLVAGLGRAERGLVPLLDVDALVDVARAPPLAALQPRVAPSAPATRTTAEPDSPRPLGDPEPILPRSEPPPARAPVTPERLARSVMAPGPEPRRASAPAPARAPELAPPSPSPRRPEPPRVSPPPEPPRASAPPSPPQLPPASAQSPRPLAPPSPPQPPRAPEPPALRAEVPGLRPVRMPRPPGVALPPPAPAPNPPPPAAIATAPATPPTPVPVPHDPFPEQLARPFTPPSTPDEPPVRRPAPRSAPAARRPTTPWLVGLGAVGAALGLVLALSGNGARRDDPRRGEPAPVLPAAKTTEPAPAPLAAATPSRVEREPDPPARPAPAPPPPPRPVAEPAPAPAPARSPVVVIPSPPPPSSTRAQAPVRAASSASPTPLEPVALPRSSSSAEPGAVHEVRRGDTLWMISRRYYGNPLLWPAIFGANHDQVVDPDRILPGERLRLPAKP